MPSPILTVPVDTISGAGVTPQAPAQAFGASAAGAGLAQIGGAEGQASDAMFQRAQQVQTLNNQSAADSATGKYAQGLAEAGEQYKKNLAAELSANPSLNTEAYLGKFLSQQEGLRKDAAGTLDNPMSTQMFDQDTRRLMIMSAQDLSRQTASTQKDAITKNATGAIQLNQGIVIGAGGDDGNPQAQAAVQAIKDRVHSLATLWGLGPEAEAGELQKNLSPAYETIFKAKVDSGDIDGAKAVLSAHSGDVTPEALGTMYGALKTANAQNMIKSPVSDIYDRGVAPTVPGGTALPQDPHTFFNTFIAPHEGSATVTDSNGAQVQYGINAADNPEAPVGRLTSTQAADIYASKYARTDLPPALSNAYGDTAFLTGKGEADKLLAQAGGDTNKFIDLREQFLNNLAVTNPAKFGRYQATWQQRSEDLRQATTGPAPVTFSEAPPHFAPNADPADMRDQLLAYNQRAALGMFPQSPVLREQFLHDANSRADLEANITRDQQQSLFDTAHGYLTGGLPSGNAVHSLSDIPPTLLQGLSQPYKDKLAGDINYATQGIGAYKTPEMTANAEMLTGMSGNAAQFENTDLSKYSLSAPDFLHLTSLQASLKRGDQERVQRMQAFSVLESNPDVKQIVTSSFEQDGRPGADTRPTPTGAYVYSPQHMAFLGALKGEVDKAQGELPPGKTLSQTDIGTIARNLLVQRVGARWQDYINIPPNDRAAITNYYQNRFNRPPSPDELTYQYHVGRQSQ